MVDCCNIRYELIEMFINCVVFSEDEPDAANEIEITVWSIFLSYNFNNGQLQFLFDIKWLICLLLTNVVDGRNG